jgi:uncharacterized lipoprotein YmbA
MMKRLVPILILCAFMVLWAGCASTPSKFYTLSPTAEPGGGTATYSVAVGPVSVPATVDRPQMVVSVGPNQVRIDEFNRWASPLPGDIARVVAENLSKILGTPLVSVFPQATATGASYRVLIDVMRFESVPGKSVTLDAVWTVRGAKEGALRAGRTTVNEPAADGSTAALVAGHSRALGRLSGEVAEAIRGLDRPGKLE